MSLLEHEPTRQVLRDMSAMCRKAAASTDVDMVDRVAAVRLHQLLSADLGEPPSPGLSVRACRCGREFVGRTAAACLGCRQARRRCTECGRHCKGARCRTCGTAHKQAAAWCACESRKSAEAACCAACALARRKVNAPSHPDVLDRERRRRASALRRARLQRAGSKGGRSRWPALIERDGLECWLCHRPVDIAARWNAAVAPTADHVIPLARGGSDDLGNLRLAHRSCNSRRRDRLIDTVSCVQ